MECSMTSNHVIISTISVAIKVISEQFYIHYKSMRKSDAFSIRVEYTYSTSLNV
jgi:hypothetical protein